ncbi:alpha/beta hydrolase [Flavobacterium restrictum]|uniref:Alpha/beta hydrolase n=1 Tax=Flavobacterium restrictum TaxID=2594428 RepID=A0A553E025_9FLAO|nr:alpha/beta hydrolase [Flavobacterium restrictum]TRX38376.1 alpha/beta hydrolase [Flavobacterium restrictum]
MKIRTVIVSFLLFFANQLTAQIPSNIASLLPQGTFIKTDVAYAADTLETRTLDLYVPANTAKKAALVIWIHGGGWRQGDKYGDMENMKTTLTAILANGFAVASINYRYSTTAIFPAQIQDCNQAIDFLYKNANTYYLDKDNIAVIGFSAGEYLASLIGTATNAKIKAFYPNNKQPDFKIKGVIDFYGPSDFIARIGSMALNEGEQQSSSTALLGAQPVIRPDLAKIASATTYVDKKDPPFLIFHGDKDTTVPITLSKLLDSYLKLAGVASDFVIVPNGQHGGLGFDSEAIKDTVILFLKTNLK